MNSIWILALLAAGADPVREGPTLLKPEECGIGKTMDAFDARDIDGKPVRLDARKAVVIAFTDTTCPLCRKYAPVLGRLEQAYREQGVSFIYVNPTPTDSDEDIRNARKAHGLAGAYVHDKAGELVRALQARSTTEVFVLDPSRKLLYRGAVDDQYGLGFALEAPKHRYLTAALDAVLAGKPVPVAATTAPGCALEPTKVTYHNRISRIVQNACQECHRKGGVGPFALDTFEAVKARKAMIKKVVSNGTMPPWFAAAPAKGHKSAWANDRSLSERDKGDLVSWLSGDLPEGDKADAPAPRVFQEGWGIGKPDAVIRLPKPIAVKAEGTMSYQNVTVPSDFGEDKWVSALEVRPTARAVVHHVLVFVLGPDKLKRGEGADGRDGFFGIYVPGTSKMIFPEGFAKKVPKGASFRFQIHYTPNGTATEDQTEFGLVFAKSPPKHEVRVAGVWTTNFAIPPGADNHKVEGTLKVPNDAVVTAFMPHMHVRGKAFRYEVEREGKATTLLDIPRYDFNWQLDYRPAETLRVKKGSTIKATAWYDNSAKNPANPDPSKTVRWGPQTTDEMMIGYVEYYLPDVVVGSASKQ